MINRLEKVIAITPLILVISIILGANQLASSNTKDQNKKKPSLINGKKIFEKNLCVDCHKGGGNSLRPSKPIKGKKFSTKYKKDKKLIDMIRAGNPQRGMPSFGVHVINENELNDLIYYVRSFSKDDKGDSVNKKNAEKKK